MTPPLNVASELMSGYGSIGAMPWGILFPGVMWRFLLVALFGGISIGIGNVFRRQWIDVERIPYPQVMLAHTCLVNVENSGRKEWIQRKPFLIGIVAGLVLALPLSAGTLFPWFPDIYAWRSSTCGPGSWQIASDTPWNLGIAKHVPLYALLLLAPLHSLFSILIYTAFLEISLFASYYGLGAYTGITGMGFCGKNWCSPNVYQYPPLNFYAIDVGAGLGLFVITIVLERDHIVKTLKVAFGGSRPEEEKLEPMSYRSSWLILIASYIMLMVFLMFTGFSPLVSFVLPLSGIITWFVMSQLWGRVGFMVEPGALGIGTFKMFAWPTAVGPPTPTSTDLALAPTILGEWVTHQSITGWGGSLYTVLASYKMAELANVNPKNVLKVVITTLFVSMFVTEMVQISVPGFYGGSRFSSPIFKSAGPEFWARNIWGKPTALPLTEMAPHIVMGFAFMVIMKYLCTRFLWLPDPILALVAWDFVISLHGAWFACLAAWVIKSIVLRVGGSKLYEQWVVPLVGGFMLGDALEVLLAAFMAYGLRT